MQTIRSFIAIPLSDNVSRGTSRLIGRLRETDDGIKWVPVDNLHLTLKFLGEVDNTLVPKICEVTREICASYGPFELSFAGTGGFPTLEKARVLWVGIQDPSGALVKIVSELEKRFADLGFKPEPRDYTPHLTIGRTRGGGRRASPALIDQLKAEQGIALGEMQVDSIHLMASFLDKTGPTYQVMDRIELLSR